MTFSVVWTQLNDAGIFEFRSLFHKGLVQTENVWQTQHGFELSLMIN